MSRLLLINKSHHYIPLPLRVLTFLSLLAPLPLLLGTTLAPSVSLFGRHIPRAEWWSSGAGAVIALALTLVFLSGVLLLWRRRVGRVLHLVSWCGLTASIPVVVALLNIGMPPSNHSTITMGMATLCVGVYLYGQSSARRYFAASEPLLPGKKRR